MKVGGAARYFAEPTVEYEIIEALEMAEKNKLPVFVLGCGTNTLIRDEGFDGLVIRPKINFIDADNQAIIVGAGTPMGEFVAWTAQQGFAGLEWAAGLPGTVGGAVRGNAGAFGGEIGNSVREVIALDKKTRHVKKFSQFACNFGYRTSLFKETDVYIILSVVFCLQKGDKSALQEKMQKCIAYRFAHHPMQHPTLGSTFKNIPTYAFKPEILAMLSHVVKTDPFPVVPVAYLISQAGCKDFCCGGAKISSQHANFIINDGTATARDVITLMEHIAAHVEQHFGVSIEPEIVIA